MVENFPLRRRSERADSSGVPFSRTLLRTLEYALLVDKNTVGVPPGKEFSMILPNTYFKPPSIGAICLFAASLLVAYRCASTDVELVDTAERIIDAAEKIERIQGAIDAVKAGEVPHFGSDLGTLAQTYDKATKENNESVQAPAAPNFKAKSDAPTSVKEQTSQYLGQLRNYLERDAGASDRLALKIEFANRQHEAAVRIRSYIEARAVSAAAAGTLPFAAELADAGQLIDATQGYKNSLTALQSRVQQRMKLVRTLIDSGESNLNLIRSLEMDRAVQAATAAAYSESLVALKADQDARKSMQAVIDMQATALDKYGARSTSSSNAIDAQRAAMTAQEAVISTQKRMIENYVATQATFQTLIAQQKSTIDKYASALQSAIDSMPNSGNSQTGSSTSEHVGKFGDFIAGGQSKSADSKTVDSKPDSKAEKVQSDHGVKQAPINIGGRP